MKTLKVLSMIFAVAVISAVITLNACAETKTLTTFITITMKPAMPDMQNAPQAVQQTLINALPKNGNETFVKIDGTGIGAIGTPRYTMMEKL